MKKNYPSDEQERFLVRMPEGMRARIAELAKANNRSMNAEIVARLEASIDGAAAGVVDNMGTAFAAAIEQATQTQQFVMAVMRLREEALQIAPELADIDYVEGKPVRKRAPK